VTYEGAANDACLVLSGSRVTVDRILLEAGIGPCGLLSLGANLLCWVAVSVRLEL